jgi:hypothetical protein
MNKRHMILGLVLGITSVGIMAGEQRALEDLFKQCPGYKDSVTKDPVTKEIAFAIASATPAEFKKCPALARMPISEYQRCLGKGLDSMPGFGIDKGVLIRNQDFSTISILFNTMLECNHLKIS